MDVINLSEKYALFDGHWQPKRIATVNDYDVRIAKIKGEFVWHSHEDTDELFLVTKGQMKILFRDGEITLKEGEMYVVPKGVEHKPAAEEECQILLLEPTNVLNTGDAKGVTPATVETL